MRNCNQNRGNLTRHRNRKQLDKYRLDRLVLVECSSKPGESIIQVYRRWFWQFSTEIDSIHWHLADVYVTGSPNMFIHGRRGRRFPSWSCGSLSASIGLLTIFKQQEKWFFFHKTLKKYFERTLIDQNKSCLLRFLSVSSYTLAHRKKGFSEKLQEMW